MADNVNPIELFKEELENDDIAIRVNAVHRLKIILTIIGGETFKNQLLPYLESIKINYIKLNKSLLISSYQEGRR